MQTPILVSTVLDLKVSIRAFPRFRYGKNRLVSIYSTEDSTSGSVLISTSSIQDSTNEIEFAYDP